MFVSHSLSKIYWHFYTETVHQPYGTWMLKHNSADYNCVHQHIKYCRWWSVKVSKGSKPENKSAHNSTIKARVCTKVSMCDGNHDRVVRVFVHLPECHKTWLFILHCFSFTWCVTNYLFTNMLYCLHCKLYTQWQDYLYSKFQVLECLQNRVLKGYL